MMVFALGIAASTAIFAFVDAALVKPLPYRAPSQLVALFERIPVGDRFHLSYGDYLDWKRLNRVFTSLDVYRPDRFTLRKASGAEEVAGARVSDGFFRTLGVEPFLGRDFRPGEDLPSAQQTVLLSYKIWQLRFAGSMHIQRGRFYISLAEHYMHLTSMVRLVVKEMENGYGCRFHVVFTPAICVRD